jgi:hypothetical protein
VDALRRREHEELTAIESALATGNPSGGRGTLTALVGEKRARLHGPDDG